MVIILPALLKSLSFEIKVIEIAKYFLANFDNTRNQVLLIFYHNKGQLSG